MLLLITELNIINYYKVIYKLRSSKKKKGYIQTITLPFQRNLFFLKHS